jgi:hypothetical protein
MKKKKAKPTREAQFAKALQKIEDGFDILTDLAHEDEREHDENLELMCEQLERIVDDLREKNQHEEEESETESPSEAESENEK